MLSLGRFHISSPRRNVFRYERKLGVVLEQPIMTDTKWNLWGGVYYAASLYTTIGVTFS